MGEQLSLLIRDGRAKCGDPTVHLSRKLGVSCIVTTKDEFIVLIRRSNSCGDFHGMIDCPGGHPEPSTAGWPEIESKLEEMSDENKEKLSQRVTKEIFDCAQNEVRDEINVPLKIFRTQFCSALSTRVPAALFPYQPGQAAISAARKSRSSIEMVEKNLMNRRISFFSPWTLPYRYQKTKIRLLTLRIWTLKLVSTIAVPTIAQRVPVNHSEMFPHYMRADSSNFHHFHACVDPMIHVGAGQEPGKKQSKMTFVLRKSLQMLQAHLSL